jgi:hypothetical protein
MGAAVDPRTNPRSRRVPQSDEQPGQRSRRHQSLDLYSFLLNSALSFRSETRRFENTNRRRGGGWPPCRSLRSSSRMFCIQQIYANKNMVLIRILTFDTARRLQHILNPSNALKVYIYICHVSQETLTSLQLHPREYHSCASTMNLWQLTSKFV